MQSTAGNVLRRVMPAAMVPAIAVFCGCALAAQSPAASSLPPSAPTSSISPSQLPSANPAVSPATNPSQSEVSWDGSNLQVVATSASLNRLLQEISSKANLKITGTVPEEKIFGTYGPGKLEDVLFDLLDGMAINMIFIDRAGTEPKQLVFTSRSGGVTPSNQGMQGPDLSVAQNNPQPNDGRQPLQQQQYVPPANPPENSAAPVETPVGVRTPQQIFEQLQRLRQQANQK